MGMQAWVDVRSQFLIPRRDNHAWECDTWQVYLSKRYQNLQFTNLQETTCMYLCSLYMWASPPPPLPLGFYSTFCTCDRMSQNGLHNIPLWYKHRAQFQPWQTANHSQPLSLLPAFHERSVLDKQMRLWSWLLRKLHLLRQMIREDISCGFENKSKDKHIRFHPCTQHWV